MCQLVPQSMRLTERDVIAAQGRDRWDHFFGQPAISFATQPLLRKLFEEAVDGSDPVTLFLGAGVSIDAALPTWNQLISNVAESISDKRWRECIEKDVADPMRKAEYVTQLAIEGKAGTTDEVVRDALYRGRMRAQVSAGTLADAIARFAVMLGEKRVRIVTTNFDNLMELALRRHAPHTSIASLALSDINENELPPLEGGHYKVLHLHGLLEPGKAPRGPIVLTESEFLEHGPRVKEIVKEALLHTQVIFSGVSLTDPNLVAPLWSLRDTKVTYRHPYAITVASPIKTDDPRNARAFEIKKTDYLEKTLNVRTIFLKSYAQVPQLFHELALACGGKDEYFNDESRISIRYGHRLKRTLDSAYKHIGCTREDIPMGDAASAFSQALHAQLYEGHAGQASIVQDLRDIVADMPNSDNPTVRSDHKLYAAALEKEMFGLFLWLRSRRASAKRAEYDLRLMGSSVYVHNEAWSLDRVAEISGSSRHGAARAAYDGRAYIQDLDEGREWQLWKTGLHVPFSVVGGTSDLTLPNVDTRLDVLSVGVISFHTRNSARRDAEGKLKDPASILGVLQDDAMESLKVRLQEAAIAVIGVGTL